MCSRKAMFEIRINPSVYIRHKAFWTGLDVVPGKDHTVAKLLHALAHARTREVIERKVQVQVFPGDTKFGFREPAIRVQSAQDRMQGPFNEEMKPLLVSRPARPRRKNCSLSLCGFAFRG